MAHGLFRLHQVTDSAFPVGGYAYSHGLEWLIHSGTVSDAETLADGLDIFVRQVVGRQYLTAAALAFRTPSLSGVARVDRDLDASISAIAERDSGRLMGRRLVEVAGSAWTSRRLGEYGGKIAGEAAVGQFAVAFALCGREAGGTERETLEALGYVLVNSVAQAAVRLGVIGPDTTARLVAETFAVLDDAVLRITSERRPRIGAFAPGWERGTLLQPTLRFRMFAS